VILTLFLFCLALDWIDFRLKLERLRLCYGKNHQPLVTTHRLIALRHQRDYVQTRINILKERYV
jgi:hypothetical protein